MPRAMLLILGLLIAAGPSSADPGYGSPFWLPYAGSTAVGPDGLVVGFAELIQDSRCPPDMFCFWEGDAEVTLYAEAPGFAVDFFNLHTYPGFLGEIASGLWRVKLLSVAPYPQSFETPPIPEDYSVMLQVDLLEPVPVPTLTWGAVKALYR